MKGFFIENRHSFFQNGIKIFDLNFSNANRNIRTLSIKESSYFE